MEFEGAFYHITSRGNLHKIGDLGSNASHRQAKWETWGRVLNIKPGWIEALPEEKERITGN